MDMFPPEQRDAMRVTMAEAMKDWWDTASQDQRDKVTDMIAALEIPKKPKGKEWSDLEAWWKQLSDTEKEEGVMRGLMTSFRGGVGMWTLDDVNKFTKWDHRVTVLDQLPMYRNIPRDSLSADMRRLMDYSDERTGASIFHLRV